MHGQPLPVGETIARGGGQAKSPHETVGDQCQEGGARPVKRAIQELVLNELSKQILSGKIDRGHAVKVDFRNEQLVFEN